MHVAYNNCKKDILTFLLNHGANVTKNDKNGLNVLEIALYYNENEEMVHLLQDYTVNISGKLTTESLELSN